MASFGSFIACIHMKFTESSHDKGVVCTPILGRIAMDWINLMHFLEESLYSEDVLSFTDKV